MRVTARFALLGMVIIAACSSEGAEALDRGRQAVVSEPFGHDSVRRAAKCDTCNVLQIARLNLPETGVVAASAKLRAVDGSFRGVTLDSSGKVMEERALVDAERTAAATRYGKLRPEVALWVNSVTDPAVRTWVWVWTQVSVAGGRREDLIKNAAAATEQRAAVNAAVETATRPVREWLASAAPAAQVGESSGPLLRMRLTAAEIKQLVNLSQVLLVGTDRYPGKPESVPWSQTSEWGPTIRLRAAHDVGVGSGARVCIKEETRPDDVSLLSIVAHANPIGPTSTHARATTGIVRNTQGGDGWFYSVAPSASIYVANWSGFTQPGGVDGWCANQATTTLSYSHSVLGGGAGGQSGTDMQHDWLAKVSPYMLVVASAGAVDGPNGYYVRNRGFNGLVVGGVSDANTADLNDDAHDSSAAWGNPTTLHNDYELPHVVAPSNGADAAGATVSGTSAATAMVSGISALIDGIDPALASWPEGKRAIIAATATGQSHLGVRSLPSALGDAKMGAGVVNAANAAQLAQPQWAADAYGQTTIARHGRLARTINFTSDFAADGYLVARWKARAEFGGRLRVVLTFDATATCTGFGGPCTSDTIDADLDLHVIRKTDNSWDTSGTVACSSTTYDSTWELCDIPVSAGEEYLIAVRKWSSTASSTYMGVAWTQYQVPRKAVCTTNVECSTGRCNQGYCSTIANDEVAAIRLNAAWQSEVTGTKAFADTIPFTLENHTASAISFNLWVLASGLDGREVRRLLESGATLGANSTQVRNLDLSLAPIRSVGAASQLRIEAEVLDGATVESITRSRPLYYEADAAMTTFTFFGEAGKSHNIDWDDRDASG